MSAEDMARIMQVGRRISRMFQVLKDYVDVDGPEFRNYMEAKVKEKFGERLPDMPYHSLYDFVKASVMDYTTSKVRPSDLGRGPSPKSKRPTGVS